MLFRALHPFYRYLHRNAIYCPRSYSKLFGDYFVSYQVIRNGSKVAMLTWWHSDDRWVHSNTCCKITVVMTKSHLRINECSPRALLSPPSLSSLSLCRCSSLFPSLSKLLEVFTRSASIRIKLFSLKWDFVVCESALFSLCLRSDKMRSMIKLLSRCVFERVCTLACSQNTDVNK